VNRQTLSVAQTLIAPDFHLALDVLRDLAAQVTLDLDVLVDVGRAAATSSSVRSRTRVSRDMPVASHSCCAVVRRHRRCR
jgi:hypothetical protein